jgi:formyl-CoA transferase
MTNQLERESTMPEDGTQVPPLAGIRVLDIATLLAAPSAATCLAEFGADVIKVEQPKTGDHQRRFGNVKHGQGLTWLSLARNKRSVTLDLRIPSGVEVFKRLVKSADVVIENFRPGTLERWGIGPEELFAINPGVVILRVTGYGQTGPYASRPGFGTLAEAMSGFAHFVGEVGGPPTLPPFPLADGNSGLTGAYSILIALRARDNNGGLGQVIDLSLYEPIMKLMEPFMLDYDQLGIQGRRMGNRSDHIAPRNAYRCKDGAWIALSASAQSIVERLLTAIGRPELVTDPRFADSQHRIANADALDEVVAGWFIDHTSADALETMAAAQVSVGLVYDVPAIFDDPHVHARQDFVTLEDPTLGPVRLLNVVPRFSRTPGTVRTLGPALGEHSEEILTELGISEAAQKQLHDEGAV